MISNLVWWIHRSLYISSKLAIHSMRTQTVCCLSHLVIATVLLWQRSGVIPHIQYCNVQVLSPGRSGDVIVVSQQWRMNLCEDFAAGSPATTSDYHSFHCSAAMRASDTYVNARLSHVIFQLNIHINMHRHTHCGYVVKNRTWMFQAASLKETLEAQSQYKVTACRQQQQWQ